MTPPPKHFICQKTPIPQVVPQPPNHHHHHHHRPYMTHTIVQCLATSQREAAPAAIANRGQSQGPDAGPDSQSSGFPPSPPPPPPPPRALFRHSPPPVYPLRMAVKGTFE